MECQASNITANVQSDHLLHGYMLPVLFATNQLHRPPRSVEIQPMLQHDASATRPYCGLVLDTRDKMKKDEKFVHHYRRLHISHRIYVKLAIDYWDSWRAAVPLHPHSMLTLMLFH